MNEDSDLTSKQPWLTWVPHGIAFFRDARGGVRALPESAGWR